MRRLQSEAAVVGQLALSLWHCCTLDFHEPYVEQSLLTKPAGLVMIHAWNHMVHASMELTCAQLRYKKGLHCCSKATSE